jgi:PadR family transcriptional regulator
VHLGIELAGGRVKVTKDLVAASATPMVLGILAEADSYGYAILRRINELSGGELDWTEGLLYPLLHRLERLGFVESSWQAVAGQRRRKYYRITKSGRAELAEQRRQWDTVVDALKELWSGRGDSRPLIAIPLGGHA